MTIADLLRDLDARGVELTVVGSYIRYRPRHLVPEELLTALIELKPDLLRLLTSPTRLGPVARSPEAHPPWPEALPPLGPRTVGAFTACAKCGSGSWVRYGNVVLCCDCANAPMSEPHAGIEPSP